MTQRFYASPVDTFTFPNGAIGYRPGGPFDCLGPFAKVKNCPIRVEGFDDYPEDYRLTCYATGYADAYWTVPACTRVRGKYIKGYFSLENGAVIFNPLTRLPSRPTKRGT